MGRDNYYCGDKGGKCNRWREVRPANLWSCGANLVELFEVELMRLELKSSSNHGG